MKRTIDGRHVAAILVAGFALVIAVNFAVAVVAKRTFGGVVVENSYVASQDYNRWLREADKERALGWHAVPHRLSDGRIALALANVPEGARITGVARHPLGRLPDTTLTFDADGVSREVLAAGRWTLRVTIEAGGHRVRSESAIR